MPTMLGYELAMTAGVVSSIIAAGILIIQHTLPFFLGVILAGVIQNASTANTWSIVTTLLHSSRLHTLNSSDSVSTKSVARPVLFLYYLGLFSLCLTALSGVLTPLGINEAIVGRKVYRPQFEPVTNSDTFALGTVGKSNYVLTRACGEGLACPGQDNRTIMEKVGEAVSNEDGSGGFKGKRENNWPGMEPGTDDSHDDSIPLPLPRLDRRWQVASPKYLIGSAVPAALVDLFGKSSYYGASVASVFDIQFRNYFSPRKQHQLPGGKNYTIGDFRFLESLLGTAGYKPIDGLIVDTTTGGVGFRDHTAPRGETWYSASWEEVLLWMEPETVCVANNVSLSITNGTMADFWSTPGVRGGPGDLTGLEEAEVTADEGKRPDLVGRAWRGAYYLNKDLGLVDSEWVQHGQGKRAMSSASSSELAQSMAETGRGDLTAAGMAEVKSSITQQETKARPVFDEKKDSVWIGVIQDLTRALSDSRFAVHRVPLMASYGVVNETTEIDKYCAGLLPNTTSGAPLVICGLIIGAPSHPEHGSTTPANESTPSALESIDRYPLYTCATAIRTSIRIVYFTWDEVISPHTDPGANSPIDRLSSLKVTAIGPPVPSPPTWGIEHHRGFNASSISPLWGPLDPNDRNNSNVQNLTVLEADYLYLPAAQSVHSIVDSLAGTGAYQHAASLIYKSSAMMPDYSGRSSYALYKQWEKLTRNESSAALLPNLLWTDLFANMATSRSASGNNGVKSIDVYERVLRYDVRYAGPVLLLTALWAGAWAVSLAFWMLDRVRVKEMQQLLNQVSTGRVVVNMLEESNESALPTKSWANGKGETVVGLKCRGRSVAKGKEGYETVGGMVVRFVESPVEGRVLELLKGETGGKGEKGEKGER